MKCIFCGSDTKGSKSVEHIIPQSFGNTKTVLKRGIVCDKCNNYFAIKIEQPFLSKKSSQLLKRELEIVNKRGKLPQIEDYPKEIDCVRHVSKDTFLYIPLNGEFNDDVAKQAISQYLRYNSLIEKEVYSKDNNTARLLAKMAIEYFVFSCNQAEGICDYVRTDPFFEKMIKFVRFDSSIHWDYSVRRYYPLNTPFNDQLFNEINYECDFLFAPNGEVFFVIIMFGVEYTISLCSYSIKGYLNWLSKHNGVSPLYLERKEKEKDFKKYARRAYGSSKFLDALIKEDCNYSGL